MKTRFNKFCLASVVAASLSLGACSDFLDKEPLAQGTEAITFKTPEQFEQAANALYNTDGWKDLNGTAYSNMDKNLDISGLGANGGGSAPESDWRWDKIYGHIRTSNVLLEKAEEYGDKDAIAASIGTAYFFRAWQYFTLLKTFGGVPIIDHAPNMSDEALYAPRNSRYEVANFIINDLEQAIPLLPIEQDIPDAEKGKVSQQAAKAFLARVLLYEATWEKYVPSIDYDLDGDGTGSGAGTTKPDTYQSVSDMLTRAKQLSKEVIEDAEMNGTYALWNECDSLSYYYLFNIDDKGGNICNFRGAGKNTNKEFIFFKKYDYDLNRGGINLTHTVITWQATNISASFGESFLCHNGLPIRISYTGSMADAQNNPEFLGYGEFESEFRNRDYRFVGCAFLPDRVTWSGRPEDNRQCTELGKPYPDPVYPASNDVKNENDPAYNSPFLITRPTLRNSSTHATYGSRKYLPEGANRPQNTESADYPLIRLAEVYLIYAEATCELGNGNISDADLDFSINKTRARAGVAPLTNNLIANVWDAGYFDHATGRTICKKMNMLDEIRRERACELFGEGFRLDDLKRWGIAHINLTGQKLGRHVLNTAYTKYTANDLNYFGEPCYYPERYPLLHGVYEGSGPDDPDYGRSIATLASDLLFEKREYLAPIPLAQMRLNPQLKQNPGW